MKASKAARLTRYLEQSYGPRKDKPPPQDNQSLELTSEQKARMDAFYGNPESDR